MTHPSTRRSSQRRKSTSLAEVAIVAAGLVVAVAAGVAAYRLAGPYADGALTVGLYRAEDAATGARLVYRDVTRPDGTVLRYLFASGSRQLKQVQVMRMVDGKLVTVGLQMDKDGLTSVDAGDRSVARDAKGGVKAGFSLRGNGVIDAWAYRDASGQLLKIEVSRRQDGKVDRWEHYKDDQLTRVEEDNNRDGRPDRWLTYEAGILVREAFDKDGDGRPDPVR